MNRILKFVACGAVLIGPSTIAAAAPTIDQLQGNVTQTVANFGQVDLAQSFQQSNSNIAGAGLYIDFGGLNSAVATISVWDMLPNQPGATMLASGSAALASSGFFDVFWTPVPITPGVTHFLAFAAPGSLDDLKGKLNDASAYPLGQAYANAGYVSFPNHDFAFRTYYEPVPEPATWAILVTGLFAVSMGRTFCRGSNAVLCTK
jgi:hypothetical protein